MAIPKFQQTVDTNRLPDRMETAYQVSPTNFGAAAGAGLQDIGSRMQSVADQEKAQAERMQLLDANTRTEAAMSDLLHNPQSGAYAKQGQDAFHLRDTYLPAYQQTTETIAQTIQNPRLREQYKLMAAQHQVGFGAQLDTHEAQQRDHWYDQTTSAAIKQAQDSATDDTSMGNIAKQRDTIDFALDQTAVRKGWDQNQLTEARTEAYTGLHVGVIDKLASQKNYAAAHQYFNQIKDELPGRAQLTIQNELDRMERQAKSDAWADLAPRIADANAAFQAGLPAPMPSFAEIAAAAPKHKDAVEIYNNLLANQQFGINLRNMGTMSAAQKQQTIQAMTPTSGHPGIAQELARLDAFQRAAAADDKARQDMVEYAKANNLGFHPLTGDPQKDGDEFHLRASAGPDLAVHIGSPAAIISPDEAAGYADLLAGQDTRGALNTLDGLRTRINNDGAYQNLMGNITGHNPVIGITGMLGARYKPQEAPTWFSPANLPGPDIRAAILKGESILRPKGFDKTGRPEGSMSLANEAEIQRVFNNKAGKVFAGQPKLFDAMFEAVKAAYAGLSTDEGDFSGGGAPGSNRHFPDAKRLDQAITGVMGNLTEFNGQPVAVPFGMSADQFQVLTAASISKRLGVEADKHNLQGVRLAPVGLPGSGRYTLVTGNRPLVADDGSPVTIDLYRDYAVKGPVGRTQEPLGRPTMPAPTTRPFVEPVAPLGNGKAPTLQ